MVRSSPLRPSVRAGGVDAPAMHRSLLDRPEPWPWMDAGWLAVDIRLLEQFVSAMAGQGEPVDTTRMLMDDSYACECLAVAHSGSDAGLRSLSLTLFERYQSMRQQRRTAPHFHGHH